MVNQSLRFYSLKFRCYLMVQKKWKAKYHFDHVRYVPFLAVMSLQSKFLNFTMDRLGEMKEAAMKLNIRK